MRAAVGCRARAAFFRVARDRRLTAIHGLLSYPYFFLRCFMGRVMLKADCPDRMPDRAR